jgi:hypothetical protein
MKLFLLLASLLSLVTLVFGEDENAIECGIWLAPSTIPLAGLGRCRQEAKLFFAANDE